MRFCITSSQLFVSREEFEKWYRRWNGLDDDGKIEWEKLAVLEIDTAELKPGFYRTVVENEATPSEIRTEIEVSDDGVVKLVFNEPVSQGMTDMDPFGYYVGHDRREQDFVSVDEFRRFVEQWEPLRLWA